MVSQKGCFSISAPVALSADWLKDGTNVHKMQMQQRTDYISPLENLILCPKYGIDQNISR